MDVKGYRSERHSVTNLQVHLVCMSKYRYSVFCNQGLKNIEASFRSVAEKMDFQILEFNGEGNHVHALIEYPPKLSVSQLCNHLKGVSSRMYRKGGFKCPSTTAVWEPSYFADSVGGASLETLIQYIRNQARPAPH